VIITRLRLAANLIEESLSSYTLFDAGCRTMALKPFLSKYSKYIGGDLRPAENVLVCDLSAPLPFESNTFDIVAALDVLEHLDNPHFALQELIRVADKAVIISLPNIYYFSFRINFLLGNGISGKYRFPAAPIMDRHRWILSYTEAKVFLQENTKQYKIKFVDIFPLRSRYKWPLAFAEKTLAKIFPNLFIYGLIVRIDKI
jgi:SAM-dependent methyltransferase